MLQTIAPEETAATALVGAERHATKKEGQSALPGPQLGSFSDYQRRSLVKHNCIGTSSQVFCNEHHQGKGHSNTESLHSKQVSLLIGSAYSLTF